MVVFIFHFSFILFYLFIYLFIFFLFICLFVFSYCFYQSVYETITKTCLYNFDPLKPHFHIVKLGFTVVYNILLISAQNIDCGYSFEPPRRGGSNGYPQSLF